MIDQAVELVGEPVVWGRLLTFCRLSLLLAANSQGPPQEAYVALDMVATEKLQSHEMKLKMLEEESPKVTE